MHLKREQIANTIRQKEEQRKEEHRRKQQLRREYLTVLKDVESEKTSSSRRNFIPNILIGILFVGFPLCDVSIDWLLVTIVAVLNLLPILLLYSPSSWMNLAEIALLNLVVLDYSDYLYDLPKAILAVNPFKCLLYIVFNALIGVSLYAFYVKGDQRPSKSGTAPKKRRRTINDDPLDEDIEIFRAQMDLQGRADFALCAMILLNIGLLIVCGIIPPQALLKSLSLFKRLFL